jgi:hypothetical protein
MVHAGAAASVAARHDHKSVDVRVFWCWKAAVSGGQCKIDQLNGLRSVAAA